MGFHIIHFVARETGYFLVRNICDSISSSNDQFYRKAIGLSLSENELRHLRDVPVSLASDVRTGTIRSAWGL